MRAIFSFSAWVVLLVASLFAPAAAQRGQVVFLGDSITDWWKNQGAEPWAEFYEPLGAVNTGIAGHWTTHVIQRIESEGVLDGLNSKVAILMIGTNDLGGGQSEAEISGRTGTILGLIRQKLPGVKIILLGVLPRNGAAIHERVRNLNNLNQFGWGGASDVWYLNMEDQYATGLGQLMPGMFYDGLHLTTDGYWTWARTMNPLLYQLLGGK